MDKSRTFQLKQRDAELTQSSQALYETKVLRKTDYSQTYKKFSGKEYNVN